MRASSAQPHSVELILYETTVLPDTNAYVRTYEYRIRPVDPVIIPTDTFPKYCDAVTLEEQLACTIAILTVAPGGDFAVGACTGPVYNNTNNTPARACWITRTAVNGSFEPRYHSVLEYTLHSCILVPPRTENVITCSDGWNRSCQTETPPLERRAQCNYPYLPTGLIYEERQSRYELRIDPIQTPQEPSPKADAKVDRAIPLLVTMTRSNGAAAETQNVTFDLTVDGTSAGMNDALANGGGPRPRGWLLPNACAAEQQRLAGKDQPQFKLDIAFKAGENSVTKPACYVASEYSGAYTLEGKCDALPDCVRTDARRAFNVQIAPVLTDMLTSTLAVEFVGARPFTPSNHWLTAANIARFGILVTCWNDARRPDPTRPGQFLDPLLHVNDASLMLGGKFSINGTWAQISHELHRLGASLDIRANSQAGAVTPNKRSTFMDCSRKALINQHFETSPPLRAGNEHFHLNF